MKKFIITIDTEGDNLWEWKQGDEITTENVKYLPRFQKLCNDFGFKPVWLTNYEMLQDSRFLEFIANIEQQKIGELGMHLHAWSTPPNYDLTVVQNGAPYLIEYPTEIMEEKISVITNFIKLNVGVNPISHRAGRWAMDERYFKLLIKYGYKVDCSVTPHIDWSSSIGASKDSKGCNYKNYPENPYWIKNDGGKILELPVSIRKTHKAMFDSEKPIKGIIKGIYHAIKGNTIWLRPNGRNISSMIKLVDIISKSQFDFAMATFHSSELMPGGSPTFKTKDDIENLYVTIKEIFQYCSYSFEGITMRDYYSKIQSQISEAK